MCGIAYVSISKKSQIFMIFKVMRDLTDRGKDSWGVGAISSKKLNLQVAKGFGKLNSLRNKILILKFLLSGYRKFLLHTRLATSGLAGLVNNIQPIVILPNFLLVHNGLMLGSFTDFVAFESDSNYLASKLCGNSDWHNENALNELIGEISIIYFKDNKIFFFSNVGNLYESNFDGIKIITSEPMHDSTKLIRRHHKSAKVQIRRLHEIEIFI